MTRRKYPARVNRNATPGPHRFRGALRVEPLEARRLLAGLQVSVFVDQDGSRSFQPAAEAPAPNRIVYIDLNESGTHDPNEPTQVTGADGIAYFDDLEAGDFSLGILTNPQTQVQSTSTSVKSEADPEFGQAAALVLTDDAAQFIWAVDFDGRASNVLDPSVPIVDFGGPIAAGPRNGSLVSVVGTGPTPAWHLFDLETGQATVNAVVGLNAGEQFLQVAATETSNEAIALIGSPTTQRIVRLSVDNGFVAVAETLQVSSAHAIASGVNAGFSHGSDAFLAKITNDNETGWLEVVPTSTGLPLPITELGGPAEDLVVSGNGKLILVSLRDGGLEVFRIEDHKLVPEANLADASGPIVADAADGRVITGSSSQDNLLLVWDSQTWLPVGSSQIPIQGNNTSLHFATTDAYGDTAFVATSQGVYSVELAVASMPRLSLGEEDLAFEFGVRVTGQNTPPVTDSFPEQSATEDEPETLDLFEHPNVTDAEGDALWYIVATPPTSGQLVRDDSGTLVYVPEPDFNGIDQAALWVHDGLERAELTVHWNVQSVNDAPLEILSQFNPLSEAAAAGQGLGFLTVVDPDAGATYEFSIDDPRFEVRGREVFFAGGILDFESEPEVELQVTAVDVEYPEHRLTQPIVVQVTNVNEPPGGIVLDLESIEENVPGASVGSIIVQDPEADAEYEFELSDARFEIADGELKLVDGVALDHEEAASIELTVTAKDSREGGFSTTVDAEISVADVNEPPTSIEITDLSIEADRSGAVVGRVLVQDPEGDNYDVQVNDERFEVVDGVLRLRENVQLENDNSSLNLTLSATAANGDSIESPIDVTVTPRQSPHQNPDLPTDVNGDGIVTPVDALIVLNMLNRHEELPDEPSPGDGEENPALPDVSGDGALTPLDALLIINELNNRNRSDAEGEAFDLLGFPVDSQRHEEDVDSELEMLLEELSRQRLH